MHWRAPLLVTLFAVASIGATSPPLAKAETVKISRRHPFAICIGVCPQYDLQVHSDGHLEIRRVSFDEADQYDQFTVPVRKAAKFIQILQVLRPHGDEDSEERNCGADDTPEDARLRIDVTELEIVWIGPDMAQHLEGCATSQSTEALSRALMAIGLYLDGRKIDGSD